MILDMAPSDKLFAAISIIQSHILANGSEMIPAAMFGTNHFKTQDLELAERLPQEIINCVETGEEAMEKAAKDD